MNNIVIKKNKPQFKFIKTVFTYALLALTISCNNSNKNDSNNDYRIVPCVTHCNSTNNTRLTNINTGNFKIDKCINSKLEKEAYILDITKDGVRVEASSNAGFFYANETLNLLKRRKSNQTEKQGMSSVKMDLPILHIEDSPRFKYRALMLDVSRYFITKDEILRITDCMAMLKLNKLHLHLTDDNGWRLEIKKYPRLTDVGAWKVDRTEKIFPLRENERPGEKATLGGFYTQEDIKEIVAYAEERNIEIIPEIDIPAHSNAALASYPEYACPVVNKKITVIPGMGCANSDIIFCAGNNKTYSFIENIIDEVVKLFPSKYIHIGGDEAKKTYWEKCPLCQKKIHKEKLKNTNELQAYFMSRIGDYVRSKGKIPMGWDEITDFGKVPEEMVVLGWRGDGQKALKAAEKGHNFILTPAKQTYLIRYQGPQWFEPWTYFGNITLKDVYDFEPIRKEWTPGADSLLLGIQASLWTEFCNNPKDVEHQLFPRLIAFAEVAWSNTENRDWTKFIPAMDRICDLLKGENIHIANSMYNIQHKSIGGKIELTCIRPDVTINYTTDGNIPNCNSNKYSEPIQFTEDVTLKAATFDKNGERKGEILTLNVSFNKATGKKIKSRTMSHDPNAYMLTNGIRGSLKPTDFEWWTRYNLKNETIIIDLEKIEKVNYMKIGCLNNYGFAIHKPKEIIVSTSQDGDNYSEADRLFFKKKEIFSKNDRVENLYFDLHERNARYISISLKGGDKCPASHVRSNQLYKICFDEIIIK